MKQPPLSGAVLQSSILSIAKLTGWHVAHFRPARTEKGWRTPVSADGKGYPDLHLVRERSVFAEIKGDGDKLSVEQEAWLAWLRTAGHEVYVWTPDAWRSGDVDRILSRRDTTATVVAMIENTILRAPAPAVDEQLVRRVDELARAARSVHADLADAAKKPEAFNVPGLLDQVGRVGDQLADLERDLSTDLLAAQAAARKDSDGVGVSPGGCAPKAADAASAAAPSEANLDDDEEVSFHEPEPKSKKPPRFRGYEEGRGWKPIPGAESLEQAARMAQWATSVSVIHRAMSDQERAAATARRKATSMTGGRS